MKKTFTPAFFVMLILAFSFIQSTCSKDDSDNGGNDDPYLAIENEVLDLINAHLTSIGKPTLQSNAVVKQQAKQHSNNMANGTVGYGHDGFLDRITTIKASVSGSSAAENVAMGTSSAEATVTAWLNSAGHKANIEAGYNMTGIGVAKASNGVYYYTQIFFLASK